MICCAVLGSELSPADPASWAFIPGICSQADTAK
jgi:hypothetical protein